ncbi:hypothetical protein KVT40_004163 [Elsinoe batatas]|uniref:Uncharacterized protein n=1 Tax=Elsinoe batatas TaxID=2601811 RepID=A0A8K0PDP6_9PEZI|nr:hypothetical protein KVT40_004163 [Elsinoe batatas]
MTTTTSTASSFYSHESFNFLIRPLDFVIFFLLVWNLLGFLPLVLASYANYDNYDNHDRHNSFLNFFTSCIYATGDYNGYNCFKLLIYRFDCNFSLLFLYYLRLLFLYYLRLLFLLPSVTLVYYDHYNYHDKHTAFLNFFSPCLNNFNDDDNYHPFKLLYIHLFLSFSAAPAHYNKYDNHNKLVFFLNSFKPYLDNFDNHDDHDHIN